MRCVLTLCVCLLLGAAPAAAEEKVDYPTQVKPLLRSKCFGCHSALRHRRELRLDAVSLIRKGGKSGPVVVPGDAGGSLLIQKISAADPAQRMPPQGEGDPLTSDQIALLRRWIDQGAAAPDEAVPGEPQAHWAYQPPVRSAVPVTWQRYAGMIDTLLEARRAEQGLQPSSPAPREVLLRRVYLDLIGLPPTREQLHRFLADESPQAYETVVDQLLASPHYGERWARHWMDVWRYSDWTGFGNEIRYSQRHIWRWRDWIVEALNAGKGYDRMILEMLAADELAPGDDDAGRAIGFLARNWYKFDRNSWLDDTIEHTSKAFLGVTMKCARCHDHKYDPIAQSEYYAMRAVFEPYDVRTDRAPGELDVNKDGFVRVFDAKPEAPTLLFVRGDPKRPDKEQQIAPGMPAVLGAAPFEVQPVSLPLKTYFPALRESVVRDLVAQQQGAVAKAAGELSKVNQQFAIAGNSAAAPGRPQTGPSFEQSRRALVLAENLAAALAGLAALQARIAADRAKYGEGQGGEEELRLLARTAADAQRRAALADAEAMLLAAELARDEARRNRKDDDAKSRKTFEDAENKLAEAKKALDAARKAAEKDDGVYEPLGPSYPTTSTGRRLALARWIADRRNPLTARVAVNHIWMRHFGSPIVENVVDFGLRSPRPLHADVLDHLAVEFMDSGWSMKALHRLIVTSAAYRMSSRPGDAPPSNVAADPDNKFLWRMNRRRMEAETVRDAILFAAGSLDPAMGGPDIDHTKGLTVPRRSLYFRNARERQIYMLTLFDAPNPRECYRRTESVLPQQAFALVNSSLTLTQSRLLAARLAGGDDNAFIQAAFEAVLARAPTPAERDACRDFLGQQAEQLADPSKLELLGNTTDTVAPSDDPQQRARENLVLVLFNHNDFVTIR